MIRFISFLFLAAMTLNAGAQTNNAPDTTALDKGVRIQSSLSYSVPLTSNDADVCRLENVNVNVHRQRQANADSINATLTMSFRVLLKP